MEYWTCLEKRRNKSGYIVAYYLQSLDDTSVTQWIDAQSLKRMLIAKRYSVSNLRLCIDGKLREIKSIRAAKSAAPIDFIVKKIEETQAVFAKAHLLGLEIVKIPTDCNTFCYLYSKSYDNHLIFIPDNVQVLNDIQIYKTQGDYTFADAIHKLQGHLEIIGGRGLISTSLMFYRAVLKTLDLQYFVTENVTDMHGMFKNMMLDSTLDLTVLTTEKVKNMSYMFSKGLISNINLHGFKTNNVEDMTGMFAGLSSIRQLDLTSFRISNVKANGMQFFLRNCQASFVDLSTIPLTKEAFFSSLPSDIYLTVKVANQELVDWYKNSVLMKNFKHLTIICS